MKPKGETASEQGLEQEDIVKEDDIVIESKTASEEMSKQVGIPDDTAKVLSGKEMSATGTGERDMFEGFKGEEGGRTENEENNDNSELWDARLTRKWKDQDESQYRAKENREHEHESYSVCLQGPPPSNSESERYANSSSDYVYSPLDEEKDEFRVLILHGKSGSEGVCISLAHISYESSNIQIHLPYTAISYVWGIPGTSRRIRCTNVRLNKRGFYTPGSMQVSETVYSILADLQQDSPCVLWIDAICINQMDPYERAKQVPKMGRIYAQSELVIIWMVPKRANPPIDSLDVAAAIKQWSQKDFFTRGDSNAYLLFENPWFSRVWTLQEIVLAPKAIEEVERAGEAVERYRSYGFVSRSFPASTIRLIRKDMKTMSKKIERGTTVQNLSFHRLLQETRNRKATDPRDKLYGIIGFVLGRHAGYIPPVYIPIVDYSLSVLDIYITGAKACMLRQGRFANLNFLRDAETCPGISLGRNVDGLITFCDTWPSWVPDWRIPLLHHDIRHYVKPLVSRGRCPDATVVENHVHEFSHRNGPCLRARGFLVLTIQRFLLNLGSREHFQDHAEILNEFPVYYPASNLTYLDIYINVCGPEHPDHYRIPGTARTSTFWKYHAKAHTLSTSRLRYCGHHTSSGSSMEPAYTNYRSAPRYTRKSIEELSNISRIPDPKPTLRNWLTGASKLLKNRKVFISTTGFMGHVPLATQASDEIAILFGADVPFVVRQDIDHYLLIGECYVWGLMDGEAMEDLDESRVGDLWFW